MDRIVIATHNPGKLAEFQRILRHVPITLDDLRGFPKAPKMVEDADSYHGNALLKAQAIAAHTGLPALADDSGLEVDALDGAPGIKSARFGGEHAGFDIKLPSLLALLKDVPIARRGACFRCALCLVDPQQNSGAPIFTEGCLLGYISAEPRGKQGFGYDPVFVPTGSDRTLAELSRAEKDQLSHRGQALRKLLAFLPGAQAH
ncbi:MAG: RdgB/HAM1 family non-canonical purine NTP pyrophosphatase [Myxococcales bacterium]|nr:RdgB/HAM1 family non-canonical purine NTP pyrophosphatase [Myxococcales bacterium]MCB9708939.1 RdgB/HAM1 family non-canonical purine NTP pyrophosphatase [Myxococcales bacterium]